METFGEILTYLLLSFSVTNPLVQTSPAVRIKDGSHDFHRENL